MSYYVLNERKLDLPESFNGIAVFYPKAETEAGREEQQTLFQRLFGNGLGLDTTQLLWVELDPADKPFTFKNKSGVQCCLFFGVDPAKAGFRVQLPANRFVGVNAIQLLQTESPRTLNQQPELKKTLWAALQVLK